jgi:hypothetical protein
MGFVGIIRVGDVGDIANSRQDGTIVCIQCHTNGGGDNRCVVHIIVCCLWWGHCPRCGHVVIIGKERLRTAVFNWSTGSVTMGIVSADVLLSKSSSLKGAKELVGRPGDGGATWACSNRVVLGPATRENGDASVVLSVGTVR